MTNVTALKQRTRWQTSRSLFVSQMHMIFCNRPLMIDGEPT
ncbi:5'(3')-deoxyribonucleotidase [Bradyrhizobium sp. JR4.1]